MHMKRKRTSSREFGSAAEARYDKYQSEAIAQILDEWREPSKLSLVEVAKKSGVDPTLISAVRGGYRSLRPDDVEKIAGVFGKETSSFYSEVALLAYERATAELRSSHRAIASAEEFREEIKAVFSLAKGNKLIQITSEMPMNARDTSINYDQICLDALKDGTNLHFVFPSSPEVEASEKKRPPKHAQEDVAKMAQVVFQMRSGHLHGQFNAWKESLAFQGRDQKIKENVHLHPVDVSQSFNLFFFSPAISHILVETRESAKAWAELDYKSEKAPARCLVELSHSVAHNLQMWFSTLER
jgi:transcriptional regulator with XRE-family HTH domain